MTITYTDHLRLPIPDFLTSPWHADLDTAIRAIDAAIYEALLVGGAASWTNSTVYTIGNIVISPQDGSMWICAVAHTSAASPTTFSADRLARPSLWNPTATIQQSKGAWTGPGTSYIAGDFVTIDSRYAVCAATHTSSAAFNTDLVAGRWNVLLDLGRERLTGNLTLYVRGDGNDLNNGRTDNAAGAFREVNAALAYARDRFDRQGFNITISARTVTAGVPVATTYGPINFAGPWVGGGVTTILGDAAVPSNCLITTAGANAALFSSLGDVIINGFKLVSAGNGLVAYGIVSVTCLNIEYGACTGGAQNWGTQGGQIEKVGNCTISGGATNLIQSSHGGRFRDSSGTTTWTADVTYTGQIVYVLDGGSAVITGTQAAAAINTAGASYWANGHTITGQQWYMQGTGTIQANGFTPPVNGFFPGTVNGAFQGVPVPLAFTVTGTWTKQPSLKYVVVELTGAGGGGQSSYATNRGGAGGGAGGYSRKIIPASLLGATETVTINAAGTAGTGNGGAGGNGGSTSFGAHCSGQGGNGANAGFGGAGGIGSNGDRNLRGGGGEAADFDTTNPDFVGHVGGTGMLGGGAPGTINGVGAAGGNYGGGGAGGGGGGGNAGGAGGPGVVFVTEFY